LTNDFKIQEIFMTEPDDDLQKILLGEVNETKIDVEDMCIDLINKNKTFDDDIEFFEKKL
jgi:hypothetical protein